jgi:hypothetical protein
MLPYFVFLILGSPLSSVKSVETSFIIPVAHLKYRHNSKINFGLVKKRVIDTSRLKNGDIEGKFRIPEIPE